MYMKNVLLVRMKLLCTGLAFNSSLCASLGKAVQVST